MSDTEIHVEPEGVMHDNHVPPEGVRLVCEEKMEEPKVAELPQTDAPKKAPRKKPAAKRTTPYNNPVKEAIDRNMSLPLAGKGKGKGKGKNLTVGKDSEVVERTEVVAGGSAGSAGVGVEHLKEPIGLYLPESEFQKVCSYFHLPNGLVTGFCVGVKQAADMFPELNINIKCLHS